MIYAGATILGRITIGRGSIIGGNVWLTHSVAAGSQILQSPNESYQKIILPVKNYRCEINR